MLTPQDVHSVQFEKSFRGYRIEDVDRFLDRVEEQLKASAGEVDRLQQQIRKIITEESRKTNSKTQTTEQREYTAKLTGAFGQNMGKLPYPVHGVIIDRFGIHPHSTIKGLTSNNTGVDIAADKGATVRAVFEGEVSQIFASPAGMNNGIIIRHGNYFTVYANLSSVSVKRGDKVALVKLRTEERVGSKGPYRVNIWRCDLLQTKTGRTASKASADATATPETPPAPTAAQAVSSAAPSAADTARRTSIEKMWSIAKIIGRDRTDASPVLKYFESRGLKDAVWDDESLRFVPNAIYRSSKETGTERWPALVAAVRKVDGTLVTLHRTFLTEDGRKASDSRHVTLA